MVSAFGVATGLIIHTISGVLGLSVVLMTLSTLFIAIKTIGATYLICLGIKTIFVKDSIILSKSVKNKIYSSLFLQGALINILNPKAILFFLSYLLQLVHPNGISVAMQILTLGVLFAFMAVIYFASIGYFSGYIGSWLKKRESFMNGLSYFIGSIFIALGLKLAFAKR